MARPAKNNTHSFLLRLTEEEKQKLKQKAEQENKSMNEVAKEAINGNK